MKITFLPISQQVSLGLPITLAAPQASMPKVRTGDAGTGGMATQAQTSCSVRMVKVSPGHLFSP